MNPLGRLRTVLFSLLLLGACSQPATVATPDATAVQGAPGAVAAALRAEVEVLASDAMEGRRAGTAAADRAAERLARAFAEAGLEPAGDHGSWFQDFEIASPPEPGASGLVARFGDPGSARVRRFTDVGTLSISATGSADAVLVSAAYGMVLPDHGIDELAAAGVQGKVALLRRYSEFGPDAEPPFDSLGDLRAKLRGAERAGAAGVVIGTHPDDLERGGHAAIAFDAAAGNIGIPVVVVAPDTLKQLEDALARGETVDVSLHAEVLRPRATTRNVLGLLPGAGAQDDQNEEVLVVGAHYDHLGYGGEGSLAPGIAAVHNGADDNASGTAVVLQLARALAARPQPLQRAVLFALWGAEEEGLLGSQYWVHQPTVPRASVLANVNLDMVGRPSAGRLTVGSHETAAAFTPALDAMAAALLADGGEAGLELRRTTGSLPGGGGSDHMSFHNDGVAAVFFFSGLHVDYHKPSDDADKLDYARMAALVGGLQPLLESLAGAPAADFAYLKPAADEDEDRGPVRGAKVWFGSIPDYGASPEGGGMQIAGTSPGSPADKAGLQAGDVIRALGTTEVRDIYDFMDALATLEPGQVVEVGVLRAGETLRLPLTLTTRSGGQ
ncbi:MAG TPA: M20/M25/M40 family metallo-hydrolase [Planctomycetota bacterium]